MSYQTIVALDLGKFKSVLCVMDVATRTHRFLAVESTPELIRQVVRQHCSLDPAQTQVVFETCDLLRNRGSRPAHATQAGGGGVGAQDPDLVLGDLERQ